MSLGFDVGSESHTGTVGSISEASFTWSHNPVLGGAAPKGILIYVINLVSAANIVSSITYDGTTIPLVAGGEASAPSGETGYCSVYFLGSGCPATDPSNVVVNRTNNTDELWAVCMTLTAATDTVTTGILLLEGSGTLDEQNVDDGSPGTNSMRFAGGFSGLNANPTIGANTSLVQGFDTGNQVAHVGRESVVGQGSRPVGFSSGTTATRAHVYVAVRELANWTRSQTDGLGAVDTTSIVAGYDRTQTDPLGLVDVADDELTLGGDSHTRTIQRVITSTLTD